MSVYLAEMIGTMILIILGDGVVANVVLKKSKGQESGWIVVATGWGLAVALAIYTVGRVSGAHINPAVTLSLAFVGAFPWSQVPGYIVAQLIGAFLGGAVVWLSYLPHWAETKDPAAKLGVFATIPAIRPPIGHKLLAAEGDHAVPTIACFHLNFYTVYHLRTLQYLFSLYSLGTWR